MKILRVRAGVLVTVTGLLLLGAGVATAQAAQSQNGQYSTETTSPECPSTCETPTKPATPPPDECECTETTSSTTSATTSETTTDTSTTSSTTSSDTSTTTTPDVLGTTAAITESVPTPTTTAPVTVLGVQAAVTNPLPVAAAAGQAETGGQLLAGGLAAIGAFLSLAGGFMLRRRRGEA